ncbi:uncharacterized protein [Epargyreus clarus]|uniref:uncharacterized protein n=1 Tax=Epargyreus clarus TaxID=520877 RepID=UPI003C2EEC74
MFQNGVLCLVLSGLVLAYPSYYQTEKFKVGIEYEHSLPMKGGSDRYRHRNNYDPFFVTVTATAKNGYVISYLEVSATTDATGEVHFNLIRGQAGSRNMVFQLVSNNSDFLAYSYLAYGIREEEYNKITNVITLPVPNKGSWIQHIDVRIMLFITLALRFTMYLPNGPGLVALPGHLSTLTQSPSRLRKRPGAQTQPPVQSLVQIGSGSTQLGSQDLLQMSYTSFWFRHGSGRNGI